MLRLIRARPILLILLSASALAADTGVLQQYSLAAESMMQWRLPNRLNEISGLAMTEDGRLLSVNDEQGIVYEINFDGGGLVKAFALGNPAVKGDFEGIAVAGGLVYLMTSNARIYLSSEGADGQRVSFDTFDTELGHNCEFEGLTQSRDGRLLYLLCKGLRKNADVKALTIFAWSIEGREWLPEESIALPEVDILKMLKVDRLSPSGLTIDADSGNFIIIAARQRALVELTGNGELVNARALLLTGRHRQAEGIELAQDGRMLIADEGGNYKARLAVYKADGASRRTDD